MVQQSHRPGFDRRITAEEINRLPIAKYGGPVAIIATEAALERAVRALRKEHLLGFDTETKPAFRRGERNPVAIIQCATATTVYIIRLGALRSLEPVAQLFEDRAILKAGVDLQQDIVKLRQQVACAYNGFVDVSLLAKDAGIKNFSMRGLAAVLLGVRISKTARTSNWARETLTPQQISYAATDAWISRELYLRLTPLKHGIPTGGAVLKN